MPSRLLRPRRVLIVTGLLALPAGLCPAAPPTVSIIHPGSAEVPYRITLSWTGQDPDGAIAYFEYAVSPPPEFTPGEIAHPENSPGLTVTVVPGPAADRDTVRVSKDTGSGVVSFDYVRTPDLEHAFLLPTPDPDTLQIGSIRVPANRFSGDHTLYVRARDDAGEYGAPDSVHLTAVNFTPSSAITRPEHGSTALVAGLSMPLEWTGSDPDGSGPDPVSYLYKLVKLGDLVPPVPIIPPPSPTFVFYTRAAHLPWLPLGGNAMVLEFPDLGNYMVAIRAVDEGGAVEPFLDYTRSGQGGNVLAVSVQANGGLPRVLLSEPLVGDFTFYGLGETASGWLEAGVASRFVVTCHGNETGFDCADVRWGFDLADPDGAAGWSAWTPSDPSGVALPPQAFPVGTHHVHVEVRDEAGRFSRGHVMLEVVEAVFDRDVLFVDDYRDQTWPRDNQHDAFWTTLLDAYQSGNPVTYDIHHTFGANDVEFTEPGVPSLTTMLRYRAMIWDTHGAGYNGRCGLTRAILNGSLQAYLGMGGAVWISGQYTMAAMLPNVVGSSNLTYPLEVPATSFPYRYLKIYSGEVHNDKNAGNDVHGMIEVRPAAPALLAGMQVDVNKQNPVLRGIYGIGACDLIFDPLLESADPSFSGKIDSLYVFGAIGPAKNPPRSSVYDGRLCAIRWQDAPSAMQPAHGKTLWFGFPMYYFGDAQAQGVFDACVTWLLEEPVAVRLAYLGAERLDAGVRITWSVAEALDHAGFHVHRQAPGGSRVRLTGTLLTGGTEYAFVDASAPSGRVDYWIEEVDRRGASSWHGPASVDAGGLAPTPRLFAPAPNPSSGAATLRYSLPAAGPVLLRVFDASGRLVRALDEGVREPGEHRTHWDGRTDAGGRAGMGLYLIELRAGAVSRTQKLLVLTGGDR